MGLAKPKTYYYALDQYLKIERESEERNEFVDGEIYAKAGESGRHGDISMNMAADIQNQLRGSDCRARSKDTKVISGALKMQFGKGMISCPDIVS